MTQLGQGGAVMLPIPVPWGVGLPSFLPTFGGEH
jgi:hypothetical protein